MLSFLLFVSLCVSLCSSQVVVGYEYVFFTSSNGGPSASGGDGWNGIFGVVSAVSGDQIVFDAFKWGAVGGPFESACTNTKFAKRIAQRGYIDPRAYPSYILCNTTPGFEPKAGPGDISLDPGATYAFLTPQLTSDTGHPDSVWLSVIGRVSSVTNSLIGRSVGFEAKDWENAVVQSGLELDEQCSFFESSTVPIPNSGSIATRYFPLVIECQTSSLSPKEIQQKRETATKAVVPGKVSAFAIPGGGTSAWNMVMGTVADVASEASGIVSFDAQEWGNGHGPFESICGAKLPAIPQSGVIMEHEFYAILSC